MTESTTTTSTTAPAPRQILAAKFDTGDGAARAAAAVVGAVGDSLANTAVIYVKQDGTAKFTETKDWGSKRGAVLGGAIGMLGGPVTALAGGAIGALASKLRDAGFPNGQLQQLGDSLQKDQSIVLFEIASDALDRATRVLDSLDAARVVTLPVESRISGLFA